MSLQVAEPTTSDSQDTDLRFVKGTKQNKELIAYCEGNFKRVRDARVQFEKQWYLNLAFYFGRQHAQWVAATTSQIFSRLWEPPAPPWRVRLVVNKTRAIIRTELAKVTKERPRGFVIPSSSDDDDLAAARAGDAIYEHLSRELNLASISRRVMFWTLLCGTAFTKDWYDKDKADSSKKKGSIEVEPVSPFHLFVSDLEQEDIEKQAFVIHSMGKSKEWVKTTFKKDVTEDSNSQSGLLEQRFLSAIGLDGNGQKKNFVSVKEMWVKPCGKFPKGALIIWAGDEILAFREGFPYEHGQYPFVKFEHIPTGRFYADSTIVDLIPLQKEYNRTRSQIIESKNRMSKPQLLAPRGSVDPTKITTEPGLIIFYTPGFNPPTPLPLQNLPPYVIEELDRTQRDMDDVSSQHEVTKGRTPPGVTAATAISYLQEEDDSKLAATIASLEEGVEKIGRHLLSHVQQYWAAERQIKVIGDNGQYEAYQFSKSDIKGNTDFRVEAGSATPRSRAAKQAFIMELGKMGWIPPDRALRYLDMAETGRLYEEMQIDVRQAQRENLMMAGADIQQAVIPSVDPMTGEPMIDPETGQPVPPQIQNPVQVHSWDEDIIHIMEHDNYRKKQVFESSPDETKMLFEEHVSSHKAKLAGMMGMPYVPGDLRVEGMIKQVMSGMPMPGMEGGPPSGEQQSPMGDVAQQ